jgi:hypothetical protein
MSLQIQQGDYIFYQDTSVGGPPVYWDWSFPGGTPTGSSSQNQVVRYLSPYVPGYNASLYVEDSFGVFSSKTVDNAISVTSENLSSVLLLCAFPIPPTANTSLFQEGAVALGQELLFSVTGPTSNLSYYSWNLAGTGGFTGTTANQSLKVQSWLDLTGSEYGGVYNVGPGTPSALTYFSTLNNSVVAYSSALYLKAGLPEDFNFLGKTGSFTSPTGSYIQTIKTSTSTSSTNLGGGGYIFQFNQPLGPTAAIENSYSGRVEGERIDFWSCSLDFAFPVAGNPGALLNMEYLASQGGFQALGVTENGWENLTRYTEGNYMFSGDLTNYFNSTFYLGDVSNATNIDGFENIGDSALQQLFFNDSYYASQSSVSLSARASRKFPAGYLLSLDGGLGAGQVLQCLPSPGLAGTNVRISLWIQFSYDGTYAGNSYFSDIIEIYLPEPGNSPDGTLYLVQDTIYQGLTGIASYINSALASAPYGPYSNNIEAFSSPDYCWRPADNSSTIGINSQGLKLVIKDNYVPNILGSYGPGYISYVDIYGNHDTWNSPYNQYPIAGLDGNPYPISGPDVLANWLSFYSSRIGNPYGLANPTELPFRGFKFYGYGGLS